LIRLAIQKLSMQLFALEKLHNEHKSFREECFGIARKLCATGVLFQTKPSEIRGGKRSTENQEFEPKNVFKRPKKPIF
jgi:hypothetical protein